jgi:hypothetical protein
MKEFNLPKIFNWQKASEKIVKKYVADLYQSNTNAPVATELYNDTGVAFTFEYLGAGQYAVTANKDIFTGSYQQKVQVTIANQAPSIDIIIESFSVFYNAIIILTSDGGTPSNDILGQYAQNTFEVTFYN